MKGNSILSTPKDLSSTPLWSKSRRSASSNTVYEKVDNEEIVIDNGLGARISEAIAHFLGTPQFIFWLSVFCVVWLGWNAFGPEQFRFDSAAFGFTALTLMLSLQASYAAPLILLAQNRQADRDKVSMAGDRSRAERNLVDTEYLMREIASIRMQIGDLATRDYIRAELRSILSELDKKGATIMEMNENNTKNGMKNVAAVDCGTNSIRLLLAKVDQSTGQLSDLAPRKTRINRLGFGVDKTGEFDTEALERTFEFEREYAKDIKEYNIDLSNIRFIATSASRDASNRELFFGETKEILGVIPEVITGDEEAKLSFLGVTSALKEGKNTPKLVVDLGGGSTELVFGDAVLKAGFSMDIGSARITERHFSNVTDFPTSEQISNALVDINAAIDNAIQILEEGGANLSEIKHIIGVAGTVTTLTAYFLGLKEYDSEKVNATKISVPEMVRCADEILKMPKSQIRELGFIHPGRVDVIQAGCLIWKTILLRFSDIAQIESTICSEHDILDGIALAM